MYADRYQPQKVNGSSLSLSVSIVGALIAAAMLGNTVIAPAAPDDTLITYTVPPTPPPPPPEPRTMPKAKQPTQPNPTVVEPRVVLPTQPAEPFVVQPNPEPVTGTGTFEGTGTGSVVVDPPKPPPPVLTKADVDPRYAGDFQPTYPNEERRAGNEGVVTLKVLIGVDGRVKQVQRLASPSDAFWRATEQRALGRWRFKPATRDGIPFESWRTMTVRFQLAE